MNGVGVARRGLGPFTSRQLTVITCVAIVSVVAIPTTALAAVGAFTSATATPAITGTNSATVAGAKGVQGSATATNTNIRYGVMGSASGINGVGVQGNGAKYGVFSNGPLGVVAGKAFICAKCVTNADLADGSVNAAKLAPSLRPNAPLTTGQSESGAWVGSSYSASGNGQFAVSINFARPITTGTLQVVIMGTSVGDPRCLSYGKAGAGYVCLYSSDAYANIGSVGAHVETVPGVGIVGVNVYFAGAAPGITNAGGTYTVTAP